MGSLDVASSHEIAIDDHPELADLFQDFAGDTIDGEDEGDTLDRMHVVYEDRGDPKAAAPAPRPPLAVQSARRSGAMVPPAKRRSQTRPPRLRIVIPLALALVLGGGASVLADRLWVSPTELVAAARADLLEAASSRDSEAMQLLMTGNVARSSDALGMLATDDEALKELAPLLLGAERIAFDLDSAVPAFRTGDAELSGVLRVLIRNGDERVRYRADLHAVLVPQDGRWLLDWVRLGAVREGWF